jgi:hypothetical protein
MLSRFFCRSVFRCQLVEKQRRFHDAAPHRISLGLAQTGAVGHGTKEVIDVAYAPIESGFNLGKRSMGMPGVAADALRPASADKSFRTALRGSSSQKPSKRADRT